MRLCISLSLHIRTVPLLSILNKLAQEKSVLQETTWSYKLDLLEGGTHDYLKLRLM